MDDNKTKDMRSKALTLLGAVHDMVDLSKVVSESMGEYFDSVDAVAGDTQTLVNARLSLEETCERLHQELEKVHATHNEEVTRLRVEAQDACNRVVLYKERYELLREDYDLLVDTLTDLRKRKEESE